MIFEAAVAARGKTQVVRENSGSNRFIFLPYCVYIASRFSLLHYIQHNTMRTIQFIDIHYDIVPYATSGTHHYKLT
jgi:hypothetical protein